MTDMLGISSNAIGAYQRALSTVSNNIANVNTEGYSRQDVVLKDTAPSKAANMFFGTGVALEAVKRQFDAFAESNLRNSTSDLSTQKPMVEYTQRVMDIMGDKSVGLSSALDDFFSAASSLSADPASTVLRSSFLRSSEGLGSRFAELSGQLDLVGTETSQALESTANQVNTLTAQLALVNQNMAKSATLDGQSAEILDRRDLLLRQLSDLVRIKTSFATNGTVNVSLGNTVTQSVVVDGQKARPIGIDTSVKGKLELVLDPYGKTESLAAASGGQMGGLQSFISQVLEPAQKNLNFLAKTVVTEANQIQRNGVDGYGQTGKDLFTLDPSVANEAAGVRVSLSDAMRVATAAQFRVSENTGNTSTTRASVQFSDSPTPAAISNTSLVNNPNPTAGVSVKVDGALVYSPVTTLAAGAKATFYLDDAKPGQQLQVLTKDGRQLLGQTLSETEKFQMLKVENGFVANATYSDAYLNQSGAKGYRAMDVFYGAMAKVQYAQVFDKNGVAASPKAEPAVLQTGRIPSNAPGVQIQAGAIVLNGVKLPTLASQTNTPLAPSDVAAWINGASTATISGANFSGFMATVGGVKFDVGGDAKDPIKNPALSASPSDLNALAAELQSRLRALDGGENLSVAVVNNGADIQVSDALGRPLSGVSLTPVTGSASGGVVSTTDSLSSQTGVHAEVFSEIRVPTQQLDFSKKLKINDVQIGAFTDIQSLVSAINDPATNTGVNASIRDGELVITGHDGAAIKINANASPADASANVLNLAPTTYTGQVRLVQVVRDLHVPSTDVDFTQNLQINGATIDTTGVTSLQGLADKINDPSLVPSPGVKASIGALGDLVLSSTDPSGTASISVGPGKNADGTYAPNALGLEPLDYTVEERLKRQLVAEPTKSDIRLSFGSYGDPPTVGSPADLAKAGLRTGAYIEGGSKDDLLVFVTGQGKASVAASYSGEALNVRDNLRSQSLVVKFTAADRYTITDASTGTELADRHYDPSVLEPVIDFEGLQLKLSHAPVAGDSYQVDGNQDGLGNNVNMLDMVDLAKKPVISGKTIANNYIDQINNVGNLAQQATITQQALTVVNDQAIAARDKVSGVNLDDEAAALIRYQQAYQACAKALQISGQLFDTIQQIR